EVAEPGSYGFRIEATGGSRLLVGGEPVLAVPPGGSPAVATGQATFAPGQHDFRLEHRAPTEGGGFALSVRAPGGDWSPVPPAMLASEILCASDLDGDGMSSVNDLLAFLGAF